MTVLSLLIPVSVLLGLVGTAAFVWSVRSSQYEDLEGAAARILLDDDDPLARVTAPGERGRPPTRGYTSKHASSDGRAEGRHQPSSSYV